MTIQAVLFDLGNTLMHSVYPDKWLEYIHKGNLAMVDYLCNRGLRIDCDQFAHEFNQRLHQYYDERDAQMIETSTFLVLKELLEEKGCTDLSDKIIRDGLNAHYAITQQNWQLEEDTVSCLNNLKNTSYQMGIVSNAGDDRDVIQLVDKFDIARFFEFVLTSAACGYRKPHPRIFQRALDQLDVTPNQTVMVGDTLSADILGANQTGIYSIWITRRAELPPDGELPHQPQAVISSLAELPTLLQEINKNLP